MRSERGLKVADSLIDTIKKTLTLIGMDIALSTGQNASIRAV